MSKPKLTPWFCGEVKPVHVGMYERKYPKGFDKGDARDFWNGGKWFYGWNGSPTLDVAINQFRSWRGLAEQPKEQE